MSVIRQITKDILKHRTSGSVLDLGAGPGNQAFFLLEQGFSVTAVEKEGEKIGALREKSSTLHVPLKIVQTDIADFKPEELFDVVLASMSLHFLRADQISKVIMRMKSWTALGGLNAITAYTSENPGGLRPYLFAKGELRERYSDWDILEYREYLGEPVKNLTDGGPSRRYVAHLIAREPTRT